MRHKDKFEIDGVNYELMMLPGTVGTTIGFKLVKMFGDAVVRLLVGAETSISELVQSEIGPALGFIFKDAINNIEPETLTGMVKTILGELKADGKPIDFDLHFAGRYRHMLKVFYRGLQFNFRDFFDESRSRLGPDDALAAAREEAREEVERIKRQKG